MTDFGIARTIDAGRHDRDRHGARDERLHRARAGAAARRSTRRPTSTRSASSSSSCWPARCRTRARTSSPSRCSTSTIRCRACSTVARTSPLRLATPRSSGAMAKDPDDRLRVDGGVRRRAGGVPRRARREGGGEADDDRRGATASLERRRAPPASAAQAAPRPFLVPLPSLVLSPRRAAVGGILLDARGDVAAARTRRRATDGAAQGVGAYDPPPGDGEEHPERGRPRDGRRSRDVLDDRELPRLLEQIARRASGSCSTRAPKVELDRIDASRPTTPGFTARDPRRRLARRALRDRSARARRSRRRRPSSSTRARGAATTSSGSPRSTGDAHVNEVTLSRASTRASSAARAGRARAGSGGRAAPRTAMPDASKSFA